MYYYNTLLVLFAGTSLCAASRGARGGRVDLQKLKDRTGSGPSSQQLELKRDATPQSQVYVTITEDPTTHITTEYDEVTSYISETPVVVTIVSTSESTIQQPAPTPSIPSTSGPSPTTQLDPVATSASSFTCEKGFALCPAELNGGCCADGYTCAIDSCIPPPDSTGGHISCPADSYLCPASLQYGCCPGGNDCGISECFTIGQTPYTSTMTITSSTAGSPVTLVSTVVLVSSAHTKASAINLLSKQSVMTAGLSSTPTSTSGPGSVSEISPVTIGGIVAGCLVGIAIFFFLGWYTYRRVGSRGNNDPPGDLGVTTTNYYDPTASVSRTPGSGSSGRYNTVTQEQGYFPKMPFKQKTVPAHVLPPPNGVVEMANNTASHPTQQSQVAWGSGSHNHAPVELPGLDRQEPVYEVEGTALKSGNRWSRAFSRHKGGR